MAARNTRSTPVSDLGPVQPERPALAIAKELFAGTVGGTAQVSLILIKEVGSLPIQTFIVSLMNFACFYALRFRFASVIRLIRSKSSFKA